jgi:PKD repeat protein
VNWFRWKSTLFCLAAMIVASVASAQDWPPAAATPGTPVACATCLGSNVGKLTPGYPPVLSFLGRYADSEAEKDFQGNFRTGRPRGAFFAPEKNRTYLLIGSALAAYNIYAFGSGAGFFDRLASHEPLIPATSVPTNSASRPSQYGPPEIWLSWDKAFYAEIGSGWIAPLQDGQDRIYRTGIDWDDRDNCYLAYTVFGWGIVKDTPNNNDGSWMASVYQSAPDISPSSIISMKSNGAYYAMVAGSDRTQVWNVSDAAHPSRQPDQVGRTFQGWAKDATKTHVGVVLSGGSGGKIYTADAFVNGLSSSADITMNNGNVVAVDADGGNFYFLGTSNGVAYIVAMVPNSDGHYVRTDYMVPDDAGVGVRYQLAQGIRAGAGLVTVFGYEGANVYGWNLRVFKITNGVPIQISLDNVVAGVHGPFFAQYYGTYVHDSGYAHPTFSNIYDATPIKYFNTSNLLDAKNNKTFIVFADVGLGDVWEIKSGDTLNAQIRSSFDTPNPNSKGTAGPYYGDRQTFSSALLSGNPVTVNWTFDDGTTGTTLPGITDIKHQFGGITNTASLPVTRHATAANAADSSMSVNLDVPLAKPAVRFALAGTTNLFAAPNASSTSPIVTNDTFTDGSDGAVEGHYTEWVLDGSSTKKLPSDSFSVGLCGVHTLNFLGHYGAYSGTGNAMASTGTDLPISINGFVYASRPYAASVQVPDPVTQATASLPAVFSANIRATTGADLPAGLDTPADYLWELVPPNANVPPQSDKGRTLRTPSTFSVNRASFSGARVRLTVTVAGAAVSTACVPFVSAQSTTDVFNSPDPVIATTGCANAGSPCSFAVTSLLNPTQAGWHYAWTLTKAGATVATGNDAPAFAPTISTGGAYSVSLVVTNAIGMITASTTINPAQPLCTSAPSNANTSFGGACANNAQCGAGDTVTFRLSLYNWSLDPACDSVTWDFGDNSPTSTASVATHAYASNGTYTVTVTVKGGTSSVTISNPITIGTIVPPPPPPPPPPPGCQAQNANSAYIGYAGTQSSCSSGGGACTVSETINFGGYSSGYDFSCGAQTYLWNFGDGGSSSDRITTHSYASNGTYRVTLTIANSGGAGLYSANVQVTGGTQPPPKPCGTMTTANVALTYSGPNCSDAGGDCTGPVVFTVVGKGSAPYDFSCATHNFSWLFDDAGPNETPTVVTTSSQTHSFGAGKYTVKVTVTQGTQTITLSQPVSVTTSSGGQGGSCPTMYPGLNVYTTYLGPASQCYNGGTTSCNVGETIAFHAASFQYDFGCSTHTFTWDFGDGGHSSDANPFHPYAANGTYRVTMHVANSSPGQQIDVVSEVKVGSGVTVPPRHRAATEH